MKEGRVGKGLDVVRSIDAQAGSRQQRVVGDGGWVAEEGPSVMIQATRARRLTDVLLVLEPLHEAVHLAERRVPHGCCCGSELV